MVDAQLMIISAQLIKDLRIFSQQKEDMSVSPVFLCLHRLWPDGYWPTVQQTYNPLHPSSPSPTPLCLSFPISLLLYLPLFSLPPLFFSSPSSCIFTIQGNERSHKCLGLLVGTIFFSWSIRKTAWSVKVSESTLLTEQTVFVPLPQFLYLPLSDSLLVLVCMSLFLSVSVVSCRVCVCLPVSCVGPLSCERWAPWALWRPAGGEEEGKRSCASSCTGTWLRELFSPMRVTINRTWQAVLELQGVRSLWIAPEVAGL